jgi:hypothetical protein
MAMMSGPLPAFASEQFTTSRRSLGMALSIVLPITIFGTLSPVIVTWLIMVTGTPLAPSFYLIATAALGLILLQFLPETSPRFLQKRLLQNKDEGAKIAATKRQMRNPALSRARARRKLPSQQD